MNTDQRLDSINQEMSFILNQVQQLQIETRYFVGAIVLMILIIVFKR